VGRPFGFFFFFFCFLHIQYGRFATMAYRPFVCIADGLGADEGSSQVAVN
jgi:hypothetical protein